MEQPPLGLVRTGPAAAAAILPFAEAFEEPPDFSKVGKLTLRLSLVDFPHQLGPTWAYHFNPTPYVGANLNAQEIQANTDHTARLLRYDENNSYVTIPVTISYYERQADVATPANYSQNPQEVWVDVIMPMSAFGPVGTDMRIRCDYDYTKLYHTLETIAVRRFEPRRFRR